MSSKSSGVEQEALVDGVDGGMEVKEQRERNFVFKGDCATS